VRPYPPRAGRLGGQAHVAAFLLLGRFGPVAVVKIEHEQDRLAGGFDAQALGRGLAGVGQEMLPRIEHPQGRDLGGGLGLGHLMAVKNLVHRATQGVYPGIMGQQG